VSLTDLLNEDVPECDDVVDMSGETASVTLSPTALMVDRWGLHRGTKLTEKEWNLDTQHDAITLADCHTALFEPNPALAENPEDPGKAKWFEQLMDTPEYHSLHAQTMLDAFISEIGSRSIADQLVSYMDKVKDRPSGGGDSDGGESIKDEMDRIRSTKAALDAAKDDCEAAGDLANGLGAGEPGSPIDRESIASAFRRVRSDSQLQAIFKMAGRFRRCASALQRQKTRHGIDDTVGVKLDGNVRTMMQSELASLVLPELKLDTLRRIAEKQALCREHRGYEPVARGPVVVVVDESGSMSGKKVIAAKALALTMGWVAKQQKRWIIMVGYSGGSGGHWVCCPPRKWNQDKVLDWLDHFFGAGSSLDVPIKELPNEYWSEFISLGLPRGKTDVIFLTDAIVNCPAKASRRFLEWKKQENVKAYGIIIGNHGEGDFGQLCDRTWNVKNVDLDEDAVTSVLSI
jgi:uncharacterized protein with von Willebrand factor type A (vWA) domain